MKITRPNDHDLTPEEVQELDKLKTLINRVVADGKVFGEEFESIQQKMAEDGKVSRQELDLLRTLVLEQIQKGELQQMWD